MAARGVDWGLRNVKCKHRMQNSSPEFLEITIRRHPQKVVTNWECTLKTWHGKGNEEQLYVLSCFITVPPGILGCFILPAGCNPWKWRVFFAVLKGPPVGLTVGSCYPGSLTGTLALPSCVGSIIFSKYHPVIFFSTWNGTSTFITESPHDALNMDDGIMFDLDPLLNVWFAFLTNRDWATVQLKVFQFILGYVAVSHFKYVERVHWQPRFA